jgi:hypothetical protein
VDWDGGVDDLFVTLLGFESPQAYE